MSEEQKIILDMLSQGKISVQEAQSLLEAMGKPQAEPERRRERASQPASLMEGIVETIRSGLSNIDFSFGDSGRIVLEERHSGSFHSERVQLDLNLTNGSLKVDTWDGDGFLLDVILKVRAGTREQAEEIISGYRFADFDGSRLTAGDHECKALGGRVYVSLRLSLPRNHVYYGIINNKNGSIEINGIDMSGIDVGTINGSVKITKVTGDNVAARTVNGSLRLEGGLNRVEAKTTNGSITMITIAEDSDAKLDTVNGRIKVQLPVRDDIGISVDARTTSGNVRVEHPNIATRYLEKRVSGGRSVQASTDNWKSATHKIELTLRSVHGSIGIEELE